MATSLTCGSTSPDRATQRELAGSACAVDEGLGTADGGGADDGLTVAVADAPELVGGVARSQAASVAAAPASIPRKARRSVTRRALTLPGYVGAG